MIGITAGVLMGVAGAAFGQVTYSVDYQGPIKAAPDSATGIPITEGDILAPVPPFLPGPTPAIVISGGVTGLGLPVHGGAIGTPVGVPGLVELDALSYGRDTRVDQLGLIYPITWVFSVDEWAIGLQPPPPLPPNVSTEGASPVLPGAVEASADLFSYHAPGAIPPGLYPAPPFVWPPGPGNIDVADGDGFGPIPPPSLHLIEPNPPAPGPVDLGDNVDAADVDSIAPAFPVYFSLDAGPPVFDGFEVLPGTGSAAVNGPFVGGDVLVTTAVGVVPVVYAPAVALGLDIFGPDTDDLDALVLWENGDGVFTAPSGPFSWIGPPGATSDMLFFSVRRGSAIIGTPDPAGIFISEGDILMPPPPGSPPGTPPTIWVAAENLGLCTVRSGCPGVPWNGGLAANDDLDALDVTRDCDLDTLPDAIAIMSGFVADCNTNGIPDACDIASGNSIDADADGIPDNCECPADINRDGVVDVLDLLALLGAWGACP